MDAREIAEPGRAGNSRGGETSGKIGVLIVDDEGPARRRVRALLKDEPRVEIIGEAQNGLEAVEAIREAAPGLVFLDIQMPGMTGFEVIQAIGVDAMPAVVLVTAHDEFALQAFAVEAIDYLVKPVDAGRFAEALLRALRRLGAGPSLAQKEVFGRLLGTVLPTRYVERLIVRKGERLVFIPLDEVEHLSSDGNYVEVHTATGSHLLRDTLVHLENVLDPQCFVRVHRGEIVAIRAVREVQPHAHGDSLVVLKSGACVRMSRRYAGRLLGRSEV